MSTYAEGFQPGRRGRGRAARRGAMSPSPATATMNLQRTAGNRAVAAVLGTAAPSVHRDVAVSESAHYRHSRDQAHADAKRALDAADSDGSISRALFRKHASKKHTGKCVTTFPTSRDGYLVVVTYATLGNRPLLTYDTAYLSSRPPAAPEFGAISYNPTTRIDVG